MTQFNAPTYDIQRPTGQCIYTGRALQEGEKYMAALVEFEPTDETGKPVPGLGLKRVDISLEAWDSGKRPDRLFCYWRSTVPRPNQKKKLFLDDDVLMDLFRRLGDNDQPDRLAFRFVLALLLMRKKLLRYDGSTSRPSTAGPEQEWWKMTPKGQDNFVEVFNPQMDEARIQQVAGQLTEILQAEI